MNKKIILIYFLTLIHHFSSLCNAEDNLNNCVSIKHSVQLKEIIAIIQKLPEAKKLILSIQKEGPISIFCNNDVYACKQFGACWNADRRIILVDISQKNSKGMLIGSIIFELHNAAVNSKLLYYDKLASRGKIKKEKYVRNIEYLEYQNSLKASKLAEQGIRLGIFPPSARLITYNSFEEYYRVQKKYGHSACIAHNFNQIASKK